MCAIVQAAENGLNVIGVENFGYLGGGLYGVEAHYTLDCKATQEAGMSDEIQSPLDAYTYHMDFNRWRANASARSHVHRRMRHINRLACR